MIPSDAQLALPLPAQAADVLRMAGATIGTLLTLPILAFLWRVAGDWRSQGDSVREMHGDMKTLMDPEEGVIPRIARQEYILTGDGGTNGVRGDVGRLKSQVGEMDAAQREAFTKMHTAIASRDLAQSDLTERVKKLERRTGPRRVTKDRRGGS